MTIDEFKQAAPDLVIDNGRALLLGSNAIRYTSIYAATKDGAYFMLRWLWHSPQPN